MNNYLTSRGRAIRQRGYDPVQVDRERKADQDRAIAMGSPVEPIGNARTTVKVDPTNAEADTGQQPGAANDNTKAPNSAAA